MAFKMRPSRHRDPSAPPQPLDRIGARWLFGTGVAVCAAIAMLYGALALPLAPGMQRVLVLGPLALAVLYGVLHWRARDTANAAIVAAWGALVVIGLIAYALGEGVHASVLGFVAVVVSTVGVLAGPRAALAISGGGLLLMLGLAQAERAGLLAGAGALAAAPLSLRLTTLALLLAAALVSSLLIARLTGAYARKARERDERFRALLRIAADWYWELDAQFRFATPPGRSLRNAGPPIGDIVGRTPWEIESFLLDDETLDAHRADLEAHRPFAGVLLPWRDRDGRQRHIRLSGEPLHDEHGVFLGYWGVGIDATVEFSARFAVATSQLRYRALFERAPLAMLLQRAGVVVDANPAALALFGAERQDELLGQPLVEFFEPGPQTVKLQRRLGSLDAMAVGEGLPDAEFVLEPLEGRRLQLLVTDLRVDAEGGPATLSILQDQTERRRAVAALRRSDGLLSHLVRSNPDSVTLTELRSGRFLMANEAFARIYGYAVDEVIGRSLSELNLPVDPSDFAELVRRIDQGGRVDAMPIRFRRKDGAELLAMVSGTAFDVDGLEYLVIVSRDVTEIERTRLEHQAILQHASIGIAFTREHKFLLTNPRFDQMFGWPTGTLVGRSEALVWPSEADHADVVRRVAPLLAAGEMADLEREAQRRDGSSFWCRLRAQLIDPTHPGAGGTIWIAEDVTERRRTEQALAAARDAAESANRAKSSFLANTSHEIRTPLNGLLGLARLALDERADETHRRQYLRQILDSAQTLAGIISGILDLSKIEAGKLVLESAPFDLHALLDAVLASHQGIATAHRLALRLERDPAVPRHVVGDPLRLRQILTNYLSNALKFTEAGEVLLQARPGAPGRIHFSVRDTGSGIDEATLGRLFRPFTQADESTTRRFGGTGLGLSICRELATLLGGAVGVDSRVGEGSSFWVELPLPPTDAQPADDPAGDANEAALEGLRVLLVEDNPVNMTVAAAMLESWGVEVEQAQDGRAAIEAVFAAEADHRPFDAVLMDVQMPGMSGHEATRRLRLTFDAQDLPIVALTAAALVSEREHALAAGMNEFLTKPIDAARLRRVLRRVRLRDGGDFRDTRPGPSED